MKILASTLLAALAATASGCVSTSSTSYSDGWVKTSPVTYRFAGPPLFQDVQGQTYRVHVGGKPTDHKVAAFDRHGMQASSGQAAVTVQIQLGEFRQGKPGAMQVGKHWYPAFTVTVPYEISIHRAGQRLTGGSGSYENALTFKGRYKFESREKAVQALDAIRKLGQKGIEQRARERAAQQATAGIDEVAAGLFEPRKFAMEVPVVRSAAGLDLEPCYKLLAEASNPDQLQQALQAFEGLGTDHRKEDGTPNKTANYGVACGIAATRLLLRDLTGAWQATDHARTFEPQGGEIGQIRYIIYRQEKITGEQVIPAAARAELSKRDQLGGALRLLFARPGR